MRGVTKSAFGSKRVRIGLCVTVGFATFALVAPVQVAGATVGSSLAYTGAEQTYTVPAGVSTVTVTAVGAPGGAGPASTNQAPVTAGAYPGGNGASVTATVPVTPGQTLYVEVGGPGASTDCYFNGVVSASFNGGSGGGCGGAGGGGSDVRTCSMSTCSLSTSDTRVVVAGGGGGGGGAANGCVGGTGGQAGDTTVTGAGNGGTGYPPCSSPGGPGGNGGFGSPAGTGGTGSPAGGSGTRGVGGAADQTGAEGGGGGGGYFGGGYGGDGYAGGGGGAGSSFWDPSATGTSMSEDSTGTAGVIITPGPVQADTTAPTDAAVVTGTAGSNGWYTSDVSVAWNWTDEVGGSGIDTNNCTQTSGSSGAQGVAVSVSSSCQDLAGNPASDSQSFMIDTTAPTTGFAISPTSPNGTNGWYRGTAPTVTLTPSDATSGVASTSYAINGGHTHTYTAPFTLPDGSNDVVTYWSTDNAGNVEATNTSATDKVDTTPPTVSVTGVTATQYLLGAVPVAGCASSDPSGSGIATAASVTLTTTGSNGVGSFTATCTGAVDNAGNPQAGPVSVSYTVVYGFGGFMSPLPKTTLAKSGSAIPVKFMLTNSSGTPIAASTAAALAAAGKVKATLAGPNISPQTVLCSWSGSYFQCNVKTPTGLKTGTSNPYTITVTENVGTAFVTAPPVGTAVDPETVYFK